jgi:hypothetical protein
VHFLVGVVEELPGSQPGQVEVILAMEERLPAQLYGDEWNRLRKAHVHFAPRLASLRPWLAQYRELGVVERTVPWVFVLVYLADIVRQLFG